jgi:protein-disulfide isomerase
LPDEPITIRVRRSHAWGAAGLAVGLIAGVLIGRGTSDDPQPVLYTAPGSQAAQSPGAPADDRPVRVATAGRPARGPERAKVTVVEFVDFECPFCGRFARDTLPRIEREYGSRVRWVSRHFPLASHPHARGAAVAAECAHEQGRYWQYHRLLFDNQDSLDARGLRAHAGHAGLDLKRFDACVKSDAARDRVEHDAGEGRAAGVKGTPTFFVNGRPVRGAVSFEELKRRLDDGLR